MSENEYEKKFKIITGMDFTNYFNEHNPKLVWYLTKNLTQNEEKSREFSQMAFIQALEKIDTYNSELSALYTWITKISINLVRKSYRDKQKNEIVSIDAEIQETPGFINVLPNNEKDEIENEEHNENVKKCEIIYKTIEKLPEKFKRVMVMREIQKMHYKEIADSIRKKTITTLNNENHKLLTPEDFFSLDIENVGDCDIKIHFTNGDKIYQKQIKPKYSFFIDRDEIDWDRNSSDTFLIQSSESKCQIYYTTTTNLSTIKSQIKKGRKLVKKKVKNKFDLLNK